MTLDSAPATGVGTGYVNGLRLLRLVRWRREFRTLGTVSLVGLPVWVGLIVAVHGLAQKESPAWKLADEAAVPGFLLLGGLLLLSIIVLSVLRFATGKTGRLAAAFAPAVVRGGEAHVEGDGDALRALLPRLRKKRLVSLGLTLTFLECTAIAVLAVVNAGPAYAANHGHGGIVVTIGRDATISRVETGSRGDRDYFLSTPAGEAIAEDGAPSDGQRWVVLTQGAGSAEAYLVGDHDYLFFGGIAVATLLADLYLIGAMVVSFRREHRLRVAGGHVPLAYSVRRLAAGARPYVSFGRRVSATIGLPALREDSDAAAQALVHRRRRNSIIAVAVVVLAGVGTGVAVDLSTRPTDRDLTLPYLANGFWAADASADYTDPGNAAHAVAVDMLQAGGVGGTPEVGRVWLVLVPARTDDPANGVGAAFVGVAEIGSAPARRAVAGAVAFEREISTEKHAPVAVTGLPSGWSGLVTGDDPQDRTVKVFGSAAGWLLDVDVEGSASATFLADRARELAAAIARHGIARFADDTAP